MKAPPWSVKRELIDKIPEGTNPSYGCIPKDRSISDIIRTGIINLDKPSGPTSHEVVSWVRKILRVRHAGHGGTLDPRVTGVLPITLKEASKIARIFLLSGKEYVCVMRLHGTVSEAKVRQILKEFVGEIYQKPPLRSAVRREIRKRRIYYVEDIEFKEKHVLFRVGCQAGTYIRKICTDVGAALGVGAHMEELRRTRTGPFVENRSIATLYDLKGAYDLWNEERDESWLRKVVQPMEMALEHIPKIYLRDSAIDSICHGAKLAIPGISKLETGISRGLLLGLVSIKGELVALGRAIMSTEEIMDKERGIAVDPTRVVMNPGTYPRVWQSRSR